MSNEYENQPATEVEDRVEIIGTGPSPLAFLGKVSCLDGDSDVEAALRQTGRFIKFVSEDRGTEYLNVDFIAGIRPYDAAAKEAEIIRLKEQMALNFGVPKTQVREIGDNIIRCSDCLSVVYDPDEGSRPCKCQQREKALPRSMTRCPNCQQAYNVVVNDDCPHCPGEPEEPKDGIDYKVVSTDPWIHECLKCNARYYANIDHVCGSLPYKVVSIDPWTAQCLSCGEKYGASLAHQCVTPERPTKKSPF